MSVSQASFRPFCRQPFSAPTLIMVRSLERTESPGFIAIYVFLALLIGALAKRPFGWVMSDRRTLLFLIGAGIFGGFTHIAMTWFPGRRSNTLGPIRMPRTFVAGSSRLSDLRTAASNHLPAGNAPCSFWGPLSLRLRKPRTAVQTQLSSKRVAKDSRAFLTQFNITGCRRQTAQHFQRTETRPVST